MLSKRTNPISNPDNSQVTKLSNIGRAGRNLIQTNKNNNLNVHQKEPSATLGK